MTTAKHLTHGAKTTLILPVLMAMLLLIAMLLSFGFHSSATLHSGLSTSYHHATADVDDPPPGY